MNKQSIIGKILMVFGMVLILLILIAVVNPSPKPTPQLATTITPTPPPSPTPTPKQWTAHYFSDRESSLGWQNSSDEFYLNEGIAKFDMDVYGPVWLIDGEAKRIIPVVEGRFNGMKAIYIPHSGNYSLDVESYYRIVILN